MGAIIIYHNGTAEERPCKSNNVYCIDLSNRKAHNDIRKAYDNKDIDKKTYHELINMNPLWATSTAINEELNLTFKQIIKSQYYQAIEKSTDALFTYAFCTNKRSKEFEKSAAKASIDQVIEYVRTFKVRMNKDFEDKIKDNKQLFIYYISALRSKLHCDTGGMPRKYRSYINENSDEYVYYQALMYGNKTDQYRSIPLWKRLIYRLVW